MSADLPEIPADFVTEPRSLGTFPAAHINRVLYGDLRDAWRTVAAAPDCPVGVREFLQLGVPPLPILFTELDEGASYRRAWMIAPGIARVDQATDDPGRRELVLEPLADLVRDIVASAALATTTRTVASFRHDWSRRRPLLRRSRVSTPFAPDRAPRLDVRLTGTRPESVEVGPDGRPDGLPELPDPVTPESVLALVDGWLGHWWPRVTGR